MGAKRTGSRKHIFLYLACGVVVLMTGSACGLFHAAGPETDTTEAGPMPSAADRSLPTEAQPPPPPPTAEQITDRHLDAAHLALAAGDYTDAFFEINMASAYGSSAMDPEAVYLRGLLYADPQSPAADMEKAYETLQQLEQVFPEFNQALEGRILSDLLLMLQSAESEKTDLEEHVGSLKNQLAKEKQKVKSLNLMIEKMKEIDLGIAPGE